MRTPYSLFQFSISLLLLGSLSACAFLIPENPSAPRYNKVEGEIRKPQLNVGMSATSAAAPVTPVDQQSIPNLPPVDPSVQARAEREMASMQQTGRSVPAENQMVMAGAADFSNVPPRPVMSGEASTEARLAKVRAELENDRAAAAAGKDQLTNDVKTQLAPMPEMTGSVPPVPTKPMVAPTVPVTAAPVIKSPVSAAPSVNPTPVAVAPAAPVSTGYIAIPPAPVFAPPPPMGAVPVAPIASAATVVPSTPTSVVVDPVVPAPMPVSQAPVPPLTSPVKEPILLRPPVVATTPIANRPAQVESPRSMPVATGGFNPMADVDTAPARAGGVYVTQGYLPSSRYVTQR